VCICLLNSNSRVKFFSLQYASPFDVITSLVLIEYGVCGCES
jgi:hypothetical protein